MPPFVPPISPAELVMDLVTRNGTVVSEAGYKIKVGPANDTEQQDGVISLMAAGLPSLELYTPTQSHRAQARCLAGDLATADLISQALYRDVHGTFRKLAYQASNDSWYLIHRCNVTAGPSMHYDSPETWETLMFIELLLSTDPVSTGPDYPG